MANYILANEFGRANIPDQLYYVMDTTDLDTLKENEPVTFGTKALVLKTKALQVMGNDNKWYEIYKG